MAKILFMLCSFVLKTKPLEESYSPPSVPPLCGLPPHSDPRYQDHIMIQVCLLIDVIKVKKLVQIINCGGLPCYNCRRAWPGPCR